MKILGSILLVFSSLIILSIPNQQVILNMGSEDIEAVTRHSRERYAPWANYPQVVKAGTIEHGAVGWVLSDWQIDCNRATGEPYEVVKGGAFCGQDDDWAFMSDGYVSLQNSMLIHGDYTMRTR